MGAVKDGPSVWDKTHYDIKSKLECKQRCQESHCDAFVFNKEANPPTCETLTFGQLDSIEYSPGKTFGFKHCGGIFISHILHNFLLFKFSLRSSYILIQ